MRTTAVSNERPRAAGRVAVRTGLLHRGGRAAAAGPRPPDRTAHREASGRGARRRSGTEERLGRGCRGEAARRRCRSWSRRCIARPPTSGAREELRQQARGPARRCRPHRRRRARRVRPTRYWRNCRPAAPPTSLRPSRPSPPRPRPRPRFPTKRSACSATDAQRTRSRAARDLSVRGGRGARRRQPSNTRRCRPTAGDREALATVRRGFHTLKGSGRMVGLTDLGDIAYDAEQVMNRLIEEDRTGHAGGARDDRGGQFQLPALGGRADARRPSDRRSARVACGHRRGGTRVRGRRRRQDRGWTRTGARASPAVQRHRAAAVPGSTAARPRWRAHDAGARLDRAPGTWFRRRRRQRKVITRRWRR